MIKNNVNGFGKTGFHTKKIKLTALSQIYYWFNRVPDSIVCLDHKSQVCFFVVVYIIISDPAYVTSGHGPHYNYGVYRTE